MQERKSETADVLTGKSDKCYVFKQKKKKKVNPLKRNEKDRNLLSHPD